MRCMLTFAALFARPWPIPTAPPTRVIRDKGAPREGPPGARSIGPALIGVASNPRALAQVWLFIIAPLSRGTPLQGGRTADAAFKQRVGREAQLTLGERLIWIERPRLRSGSPPCVGPARSDSDVLRPETRGSAASRLPAMAPGAAAPKAPGKPAGRKPIWPPARLPVAAILIEGETGRLEPPTRARGLPEGLHDARWGRVGVPAGLYAKRTMARSP